MSGISRQIFTKIFRDADHVEPLWASTGKTGKQLILDKIQGYGEKHWPKRLPWPKGLNRNPGHWSDSYFSALLLCHRLFFIFFIV